MFNFGFPGEVPKFEDLPPEVQAQVVHMREHEEKANMSQDAGHHSLISGLESMSQDQLLAVRSLLAGASSLGKAFAQYWDGLCVGMLYKVHNLCPGCGKNHDVELEKFVTPEAPTPATDPDAVPEPDWSMPHGRMISDMPMRTLQAMQLYGLKLDTLNERVICENCGTPYPSIADRMLRRPGKENCEGCVNKEKFG